MKQKIHKFINFLNIYKNIIFFYIPLIIFVISTYFRTFQFIFNYLEILATGILLIGVLFRLKKMTKKELFSMIIVGIIAGIIFLVSRDNNIIKFFLLLYNANNIRFVDCVKIDFIVRIICLALVMILNAVDIIPSVDITRGDIMRYSFGFSHPNSFAYRVFIVLLEYFYLNNFKSIFRNSIITLAIVLFLDYYTNSRTVELLIVFVFLSGTILNKIKFNIFDNKIIKHIIANSYFYFSIFIFVSFILYRHDTALGEKLNKILSSRLRYLNYYYDKYGLTFLGNDFTNFVSPTNPLDAGHANFLIRYGIIGFTLIGIGFKKAFNILFNKKNISYLVILFSFMIYAITENSFIRIEHNVFMLIFVLLFIQKEGKFFESTSK